MKWKYRYSIRALFYFEKISGKPFAVESLMDSYLLFYCMILAAYKDSSEWPTFDEFLDCIDENPHGVDEIAAEASKAMERERMMHQEVGTEDSKKNSQ